MMKKRWALAGLSVLFSSAAYGEVLPPGNVSFPTYSELSQGPMRVRYRSGTDHPGIMHYCSFNGADRIMDCCRRNGVGDWWWLFSYFSKDDVMAYLSDGRPLNFPQWIAASNDAEARETSEYRQRVEFLTANAKADYTFEIGEWESTYYTCWTDSEPTKFVDKSRAEIVGMDREATYKCVTNALRRAKGYVNDHLSLMTGYALLSHVAEIGLDSVAIETSETIPASQVKRAFCRGAARQFGIPWYEAVSVWYGGTFTTGDPSPMSTTPSGMLSGPGIGHSCSHLARHWFTAWFSGSAYVLPEMSLNLLFEVPRDSKEFPEDPRLSIFGRNAQKLYRLMKTEPVGVPYTPFAVLVSKYHGQWATWCNPWGHCKATVGDVMTRNFFDQVFVDQSYGPGLEQRYLCASPYCDSFDVIVNNADRTSWAEYPVILAVGDIPWTADDISYLQEYVDRGGVLALNEININGWDRLWLGLSDTGFQPSDDSAVVLRDEVDEPALIRKMVGMGCVFVASKKCEFGSDKEMAFPTRFLKALAARYLPITVDGNVQTLINRTEYGWAVMVVNNAGIRKEPYTKEVIDPYGTQRVAVSIEGTRPRVEEILSGAKVECERAERGWRLSLDVPPGDMRLIKIAL